MTRKLNHTFDATNRQIVWVAPLALAFLLSMVPAFRASGATSLDPFQKGIQSYVSGDYQDAAVAFKAASLARPSSGALHNWGNAEWRCGHAGEAILAWEQARWLDPANKDTQANLRYARKTAQLEAPELTWYEICSSWLPFNAWIWIAGGSFWLAVAMILLPGILRWPKSDWHQGLAAAGFTLFLFTMPALVGVHTRSQLGVVLTDATTLRLTPTRQAQALAKLAAGEMVRLERARGEYVYVRMGNDAAGWIEKKQCGLISR